MWSIVFVALFLYVVAGSAIYMSDNFTLGDDTYDTHIIEEWDWNAYFSSMSWGIDFFLSSRMFIRAYYRAKTQQRQSPKKMGQPVDTDWHPQHPQ